MNKHLKLHLSLLLGLLFQSPCLAEWQASDVFSSGLSIEDVKTQLNQCEFALQFEVKSAAGNVFFSSRLPSGERMTFENLATSGTVNFAEHRIEFPLTRGFVAKVLESGLSLGNSQFAFEQYQNSSVILPAEQRRARVVFQYTHDQFNPSISSVSSKLVFEQLRTYDPFSAGSVNEFCRNSSTATASNPIDETGVNQQYVYCEEEVQLDAPYLTMMQKCAKANDIKLAISEAESTTNYNVGLFPPANLIDGNFLNYWIGNSNAPASVTLHLTQPADIGEIRISPYMGLPQYNFLGVYTVSVTLTDGSTRVIAENVIEPIVKLNEDQRVSGITKIRFDVNQIKTATAIVWNEVELRGTTN